jgi:hypothetical protein
LSDPKKINVLCFDSWTAGSHHYVRLIEDFKKNNIELMLLHLESWNGQHVQAEREIEGLMTRDISYYKKIGFNKILDLEKPSLVIFLSTETFAHRAFQRLCHFKRIPTINLYHAINAVIPEDGKEIQVFKLLGHFQNVSRHFRKTVLNAIPAYISSLTQTSAEFSVWVKLLKDIYFRAIGKWIFNLASDATATQTCVYTDVDRLDAISKYGHAPADVHTVGNPDLIRFKLSEDLINSCIDYNDHQSKQIVYIDSGISSQGWIFSSDRDYFNYLVDCAEQVQKSGFQLAIKLKPHPVERYNFLYVGLANRKIKIIENDTFVEELSKSKACMMEPTTLGLVPTLMGMPVFLVNMPPLSDVIYGEVYTTYPRAIILSNVSGLSKLLEDESYNCNAEEVKKWIKDNSGPLPASDMPKRVAKVVLDLIASHNQS